MLLRRPVVTDWQRCFRSAIAENSALPGPFRHSSSISVWLFQSRQTSPTLDSFFLHWTGSMSYGVHSSSEEALLEHTFARRATVAEH